jgi:hypothetical protein
MAHKLANGNYRHNGTDIIKEQVATSYGFGFVWYVRTRKGRKFDTLKLAVDFIDSWSDDGQ